MSNSLNNLNYIFEKFLKNTFKNMYLQRHFQTSENLEGFWAHSQNFECLKTVAKYLICWMPRSVLNVEEFVDITETRFLLRVLLRSRQFEFSLPSSYPRPCYSRYTDIKPSTYTRVQISNLVHYVCPDIKPSSLRYPDIYLVHYVYPDIKPRTLRVPRYQT